MIDLRLAVLKPWLPLCKDTKKIPNDERVSAKKRLRLAQIVFLPSEEEFDVVKLCNSALGFMIYFGKNLLAFQADNRGIRWFLTVDFRLG